MQEPIIEFKTPEELETSLKEWQERLFLNDWIIKAKVVENEDIDEDNMGENTLDPVNKCAVIRIRKPDEETKDSITKAVYHECVLVHELLHCHMNFLEKEHPTIEEVLFDIREHALLEQFAKSLIMAKYGIGFDWFRNF